MFIISIIIVFALFVFSFVISFVLSNIEMFTTTFDISVHYYIPIVKITISHTWEGVEFMNIIAGSFLLGVLVIVVSILGLDTKRKLKLRSMRKELKRLQEALQEAQSLQKAEIQEEEEELPVVEEEEPVEVVDVSSVTPEDITKSFEDTIQKNDFLEESEKGLEEEQRDDTIGGSYIRTRVTEEAGDEEVEAEQEPVEEKKEDSTSDRDKELLEETPVEAELVEGEESFSEEKRDVKETLKQEKEEEEPVEDNSKSKEK